MTELKKTISIWKGTALAVCTVIGSGLLGLPGMTLETGNIQRCGARYLAETTNACRVSTDQDWISDLGRRFRVCDVVGEDRSVRR